MIDQRLENLRDLMKTHELDAYLVPSSDEHNSEYVPDCWQRRAWISQFDGSAGEALIAKDKAYLWTDGRYFLQAEEQLSQSFELKKQQGFVPEIEKWIKLQEKGLRLGVDPKLITASRAQNLRNFLNLHQGELVFIDKNLVDLAREKEEVLPELPKAKIFTLDEKFTGYSAQNKIQTLKETLKEKNVDYLILSALDEIAWVFNIRGEDVEFNPVAISYAIIKQNEAVIYIDSEKLTDEVSQILKNQLILIKDKKDFADDLLKLEGKVWLDDRTINQWVINSLADSVEYYFDRSPVLMPKAIKNQIEQNGMRLAHQKDAVAVIKFMHWLENNWQHGVTELSAAEKLYQFRLNQENIQGASFNTISGFAHHGAVIHYAANENTNIKIDDSNLYLFDSGGQYLEGTTDITRVLHFGNPTDEQKKHYTLVLKGHLALGNAIFSEKTCGEDLDILARQALWSEGLDYRHGTGHGVGCFLCVHEGPQRISQAKSNVVLKPGMIVSNEPGFYKDNHYGIRIENLCLVVEKYDSEYGKFNAFEDLTLVPYNLKLIDQNLLTSIEKAQINHYHQRVFDMISPRIKDDQLRNWLKLQTKAI